MLSLKWGDVLSTLLPGAVALFAVSPYFPTLQRRIDQIDSASTLTGVILLLGAALAGGVLEGFTRIAWEPLWLVRRCKPSDALSGLTADNLELYERGVQGSYKYVTFYANFAWATMLLLASHLYRQGDLFSIGSLLLVLATAILLRASHLQWTYFVRYQEKVFNRPADRRTYASE